MSAVISECGKYRYVLTRGDQSNPLVFLMLNPSTADASHDDPTIRRCKRFASDLGYSGIMVVNLYAFRATNPKHLQYCDDPVGKENNGYILDACRGSDLKGLDVVCAWGANAHIKRPLEVLQLIQPVVRNLYCLGMTKGGMPRHPCM